MSETYVPTIRDRVRQASQGNEEESRRAFREYVERQRIAIFDLEERRVQERLRKYLKR